MNAIAAIAGALLLGVSRIVGTEFSAIEQIKVGNLVAWPIIKNLNQLLYVGQSSYHLAIFAFEVVRTLCVDLNIEFVRT
jgi:hypothetical protein